MWLCLAAGAGSTALALVVVLGVAVAVLGASFTGCQTGETDGEHLGAGTVGVRAAEHPAERLRLYQQAGVEVRHRLVLPRVDRGAGVQQRRVRRGELRGVRRPNADRLRPWERVQPRSGADALGTLRRRKRQPGQPLSVNYPRTAVFTPHGFSAKRRAPRPLATPTRNTGRRRATTTGCVRERWCQLRRRGDGPRRAVRVHRLRLTPREQPAARHPRRRRRPGSARPPRRGSTAPR